ncbi:hypothetical protein C8R47DRAFT_1076837 [Mycena vitilis]|nr:hypothetical protein C8R47DRAFT_1076837 [Mycena vitilis]
MPQLLSAFILSQVVGISATGLFVGSTMNSGPFNMIPIVQRSKLPSAWRAHLYTCMTSGNGRLVFLGSSLGGAVAFFTAYFARPAHIQLSQSRALLAAAAALILAVPHTMIWMLPIYKALGDEKYSGTEAQTQERWDGLMERFKTGNSIRLMLYNICNLSVITSVAVAKNWVPVDALRAEAVYAGENYHALYVTFNFRLLITPEPDYWSGLA